MATVSRLFTSHTLSFLVVVFTLHSQAQSASATNSTKPTTHHTPAPGITMTPTNEPTREPTFILTEDPTLEPTVEPSKAPITIRATEVPSKDDSFMSAFYTAMILSILGIICGICVVYCYTTRRDAIESRHLRLEDSVRGTELLIAYYKQSRLFDEDSTLS